ncbi:MAG: PqqD family protein [Thermodesulfovibrionales bacterium]|jgi:hypothetical protein
MSSGTAEDNIWIKVFERPKNIVSRSIAGELFLVPVAGKLADMQRMFALTAVAEFIWERLDGRRSLDDIRNDVLEYFDAEEEQVEADIKAFVTELMAEGLLIEVTG